MVFDIRLPGIRFGGSLQFGPVVDAMPIQPQTIQVPGTVNEWFWVIRIHSFCNIFSRVFSYWDKEWHGMPDVYPFDRISHHHWTISHLCAPLMNVEPQEKSRFHSCAMHQLACCWLVTFSAGSQLEYMNNVWWKTVCQITIQTKTTSTVTTAKRNPVKWWT